MRWRTIRAGSVCAADSCRAELMTRSETPRASSSRAMRKMPRSVRFQFAFDALANHQSRVGVRGRFLQSRIDDPVGNSAGEQFAGDAETALLARLCTVTRELLGVAFVVELAVFF